MEKVLERNGKRESFSVLFLLSSFPFPSVVYWFRILLGMSGWFLIVVVSILVPLLWPSMAIKFIVSITDTRMIDSMVMGAFIGFPVSDLMSTS